MNVFAISPNCLNWERAKNLELQSFLKDCAIKG